MRGILFSIITIGFGLYSMLSAPTPEPKWNELKRVSGTISELSIRREFPNFKQRRKYVELRGDPKSYRFYRFGDSDRAWEKLSPSTSVTLMVDSQQRPTVWALTSSNGAGFTFEAAQKEFRAAKAESKWMGPLLVGFGLIVGFFSFLRLRRGER